MRMGPRYGVEAPYVPLSLAAGGLACLLIAARRPMRLLTATGAAVLVQAGLYLHTTIRGKRRVWIRELDRLGLNGDERLLDLGCGRGAVLVAAAQRLPHGAAIGVDLWRSRDQTGNDPRVALANAAVEAVGDRVRVLTADMAALPFGEATFDVVTSALAIHNIPTADGRRLALTEAMRVLRPGGRLLVADFRRTEEYPRHLEEAATGRRLGPSYWYGGPWAATRLVTAIKT